MNWNDLASDGAKVNSKERYANALFNIVNTNRLIKGEIKSGDTPTRLGPYLKPKVGLLKTGI